MEHNIVGFRDPARSGEFNADQPGKVIPEPAGVYDDVGDFFYVGVCGAFPHGGNRRSMETLGYYHDYEGWPER